MRAALLLALVLLAGCAPPQRAAAPRPPPPVPQSPQITAAEAQCQQLAADPQLAPLRGRMLPPEPGVPWTRAMMTDTGHADERDRALLRLLDERRATCRQAMITASPSQAVPMIEYWSRQDAAMVRLYNREIMIGDYNRAMAEAQGRFSIDLANLRSDTAARANLGEVAPQQGARAGTTAYPVESFRALRR